MVVPTYKELYLPVLKFFSDKKIHDISEVYDLTVEFFKLSEDDLKETHENSRVSKFQTRFNFVIREFRRSGILRRESRNRYKITSVGLKLLSQDSNEAIVFYLKEKRHNVRAKKDSMNISIQNFGAILESNINIAKINVIGGQNATGKSTASKLLYCFLKYNSANRQKEAYKSVVGQIQGFVNMLRRRMFHMDNKEYVEFIRANYSKFMNGSDVYDILERYDKLKDILFSEDFYSHSPRRISKRIFDEIEEIDKYVDIIEEDGDSLFNLQMNNFLESEFSNKMRGYVEFNGTYEGNDFKFTSNFNNGYNFNKEGEFLINDIFYIDSFSSLDIDQSNGLNNSNHVRSLLKAIKKESDESKDLFDPMKNRDITKLLDDINLLIKGKFHYDDGELKYSDEYGITCYMSNTASGIKQIGIIQLLLGNRKLKRNSFLIIDEPEVNLHPEWQLKLAEILVLLAKDLDVQVYINTHSPMFIEAMSLFSEKYGCLDETNFYLTQEHKLGGFYFRKILPHDLGLVYSNLAQPYNDLDKVKIDILKNKGLK